MSVRTTLAAAALTLLASTLSAPRAQAETYLTGFGGLVFGGDVAKGAGDNNTHGAYGGSIGFIGSPLGFEVDFAYSPNFFGGNRALIPNNNLATLMGNIVLSGHMGERSRMYLSGGGGIMKSSVDDAGEFFDLGGTDFGANVGGGVLLGVSDSLAIRADIRYFLNVGDDEPDNRPDIDFGSFDYWRGTAGLALRF